MPNEAMVQAWDGAEGEGWAKNAERYDGASVEFSRILFDAAGLKPGERVIDVGCGCGATTIRAAQAVGDSGSVTGLDISSPMLAVARDRVSKAGLGNVAFEKADAQTKALEPDSADVAISRYGVMFFDDPVAAFSNLHGALAPGGRLTFICWREMPLNEWMVVPSRAFAAHAPPPAGPPPAPPSPDAPGPFAFADGERVRSILEKAGFASVDVHAVDAPMRLGANLDDAVNGMIELGMVRRLLPDAPPETVDAALSSVREAFGPYAGPGGVELKGAAWLVTARR